MFALGNDGLQFASSKREGRETRADGLRVMFSRFGVLAVAFLQSRLGVVGTLITETIVAIGASPYARGSSIRILGIMAREWRQRRSVSDSARGSGLIGREFGLCALQRRCSAPSLSSRS